MSWEWWSGSTAEHYQNGPFDTEGEAIEALDGEAGWVTEARRDAQPLSAHFDAETLLDQACDNTELGEDEDPFFTVLSKEAEDLTTRVRAVVDQWQLDHGIVFRGYLFTAQRNTKYVDA